MAKLVFDALMTQFALGVRPRFLVADRVLPAIAVPAQTFKILKGDTKAIFARRNTYVGNLGLPNEVTFDETFESDGVRGEALMTRISQADLDEFANAGMSGNLVEGRLQKLMMILALAREHRVAELVGTAANYPTQHRLEPETAWSSADASPNKDILRLITTGVMGATKLVFSGGAWVDYASHPQVIADLNPTGVKSPVNQELAAAYWRGHGISEVIVAQQKYDTAVKGKAQSLDYIWPKMVAALYIEDGASSTEVATFGYTATMRMSRANGQMLAVYRGQDDLIGVEGGEIVKCGRMTAELIADNTLGSHMTIA